MAARRHLVFRASGSGSGLVSLVLGLSLCFLGSVYLGGHLQAGVEALFPAVDPGTLMDQGCRATNPNAPKTVAAFTAIESEIWEHSTITATKDTKDC